MLENKSSGYRLSIVWPKIFHKFVLSSSSRYVHSKSTVLSLVPLLRGTKNPTPADRITIAVLLLRG